MSTPEQPPQSRKREIFLQALEREAPAERNAFLDGACGNDATLRAAVEALLAHHRDDSFLERPPADAPPAPRAGTIVISSVSEMPGDRIGRYKLREQIGEGGCGVVYVAEQEEPVRRRVALKVIKLGMDTRSVVARFEAERQALAVMDHPNIAKVLDAGATETGRPYFVMELVRGIKITDYCDQNKLPTAQRLDLFIQVCHAVQHAHQKGIIHRDLKPSNILVTLHDGVPVPKVIDFGIAKATEGRLTDLTIYTELRQFIGTPAYMSPEQAEMSGLDIDTRSDIYSLGVLLYELLTGKTPFETKDLIAAGLDEMRRILRDKEPMRPSTRLSTMLEGELTSVAQARASEPPKLIHFVRGDLDWIVMKSLEKDRTRRYETANGFAADLQRHLNDEPVVARPPSSFYRFQKLVRRNRIAFAATVLVAGAILSGSVVSTWQAIRAHRAERAAQEERDHATAARKLAESERQRAEQERTVAQRNLYTANMSMAQRAWEENDLGRLRALLDESASWPERGFEWYYWQRQTHLELSTLRGHIDAVRAVAFSPDGQHIATASADGTAKVWDTASGHELLTFKGHSRSNVPPPAVHPMPISVTSVAFSPDGQRIVTGSDDSTAKLWEVATGKELLTFRGHNTSNRPPNAPKLINGAPAVLCVAFSPDGQRIVTGSNDSTAKVWDALTGRELLTLRDHGYTTGVGNVEVMAVAFSPDGQRIVTGSWDKTAKVWDATTGKELLTLKTSDVISSVAFSPDSRRIVTGDGAGIATVWDAASGKELLRLKGHGGSIQSVTFSADGQRIATGSIDNMAKVWDSVSGKDLLSLKGHSDGVSSVAFSADGRRIVTGGYDATVKLWDAAPAHATDEPRVERFTLKWHGLVWSDVPVCPRGQRLFPGIVDRDGRSGGSGPAGSFDRTPGQQRLANRLMYGGMESVTYSPDGRRVVTGHTDGILMVWDTASGGGLFPLEGLTNMIWCAAFSPDGQRFVAAAWGGTAKVWETTRGKELCTLNAHSSAIQAVAFSPDGQRIVTGSSDGTAKVWDAETGKELVTLNSHGVICAAFSADGRRVVTGSSDQTAIVWETTSGKQLLALKGHRDVASAVAFSPDGRRIATANPTIKLWDATSGRELLNPEWLGHGAGFVAFSRDGQRLAASSPGALATKVWEAATPQEVAAWQTEETAVAELLAARERAWVAEQERDQRR